MTMELPDIRPKNTFTLKDEDGTPFTTPSVDHGDPVNNALNAAPGNLREKLGPLVVGISKRDHESRTRWVLALGLPSVYKFRDAYFGQRALIVGGGPSLDIDKIREGRRRGYKICAVNKSHDWLIANGIVPDFAVMVDPAPRHAGYMTPHADVTYLFGTTLHPRVWQRFREAGIDPHIFIPAYSYGQDSELRAQWPDAKMVIIAGVTTVGLRTVNLLGHMGFLEIELHGFDSCYAPGCDGIITDQLYAYDKPLIQHDPRRVALKSYRMEKTLRVVTNGAMAFQLMGFASMLKSLPDTEINGRVGQLRLFAAGDGAIPWMCWADGGPEFICEHLEPERMAAKYGPHDDFDYKRGQPTMVVFEGRETDSEGDLDLCSTKTSTPTLNASPAL